MKSGCQLPPFFVSSQKFLYMVKFLVSGWVDCGGQSRFKGLLSAVQKDKNETLEAGTWKRNKEKRRKETFEGGKDFL